MSLDTMQASNTCGCCEPETSPAPRVVENRPGLSSIGYRIGTYGSFLEAMTEQIAHVPELRERWLTRSTDDFDIALLAMWAYVADILTFYQERIANEAYVRTALLQESVIALAALLDYEPAPGAAAEADLAFFLDQAKNLTIPIGLRVQSVPGQNEKPQKFETIDSILADATLNQLQIFPQPTVYQPFANGRSQAILLSDPTGLAPRVKLAIFNPLRAELKAVTGLSLANTQRVLSWSPAIQSSDFHSFVTQTAVYANEYRLFGYNAPSSYVQTATDPAAPGKVGFTLITAPYNTSQLAPPPGNRLALDAHYKDLKAGGYVLIAQAGSSADPSNSFSRLTKVTNVSAEPAVYGPLQDTVTWLTLGIGVAQGPVAVLDSFGYLNAFVVGDDDALWTISQVNADGSWSTWRSLGGQIDLLVAGANQDGRLEVFARGSDKALWHIWQTAPGGPWSSWSWLGAQIDLLAVGSNRDGRLEVFARGIADQALWHIWQIAPTNSWSGWYSLGGRIDLLSIASNQDGRLEVFARGTDQGLWHIWQSTPNNNVWSSWDSLGGQIDLLSLGSNQDGRLEVFARGTDQGLWHIWQTAPNNNAWSSWDSLGGQIDLLSVNSNQDGRLEVFARGADLALWHIRQLAPNNGWGTWDSLGGQVDRVFAARNQDGRLEAFARGTDQALWHIGQSFPNGNWDTMWGTRGLPMWVVSDGSRGRITVYDVSRLLQFSTFEYGDAISGNTIFVPLAALPGMDAKRSIILDDGAANPQTVVTQSVQAVDTNADGLPDHWKISFTPDLARTLATATATLYGNVSASTHGQTIAQEVLGDGDASTTFQTFRLQKSPVTFVHQAGAPHGVADTLQIQVAGVFWKEVQDFFGTAPTDRIFMTSQDAKGMIVQFGDGVAGRRLPTGRGNVVATYRQGIGLVGNVASGALRTLLDRPVGLKSVKNPGAAAAGADPESLDQTRSNAPNTVRTFGRVVSLEDFEDAAREFAGVAKAHASWAWNGEEQVVYLTVAGDNGALITGNAYNELFADLNARRDPNRSLMIQTYTPISIQVAALVFVGPDHVSDDVVAAVQAAVIQYFSFANRQFGQPVHLSGIYSAIQSVDGVTGADISALQFKYPADAASHGGSSAPVQVHLRIGDSELAQLENPDTDSLISVGQVQS